MAVVIVRNITYTCKVAFGHPCLLPRFAALAPQLTTTKPESLTRSTGINALSHLLEAYMIPSASSRLHRGMAVDEVDRCDEYALTGLEMVLSNLETALSEPSDVQARLYMQIAALYGAKACEKGGLGSVHAGAHALASRYQVHHGTAIAHMFFPTMIYCEAHIALPEEAKDKHATLLKLIQARKPRMQFPSISFAVGSYLSSIGVHHGTRSLSPKLDDEKASMQERMEECTALAELALDSKYQDNAFPMSLEDYEHVFQLASDISYKVL